MQETKEELIYLSQLAEQAERYDEMVDYATRFAKMDSNDLSTEE